MTFDLNKLIDHPKTLEEAVQRFLFILTDHDKEIIRNHSRDELKRLHLDLGTIIRGGFGLDDRNIELMLNCKTVDINKCSMVIVIKVWEELTHSCPL